MERRGDNLVVTFETIDTGGELPSGASPSDVVTYKVLSKNKEETGKGTQVGSTASITGAGTETKEISGLEELVRFEIGFSVVVSNGDELARWARWRIMGLSWNDDPD
jgi:hypothetical protein